MRYFVILLAICLQACGSASVPNWISIDTSGPEAYRWDGNAIRDKNGQPIGHPGQYWPDFNPQGQYYIDTNSIVSDDNGLKSAKIYVDTPGSPVYSRANLSLEFDCPKAMIRVAKSVHVTRESGLKIDLTFATPEEWVPLSFPGFNDVFNFVCKNQGDASVIPESPEQTAPAVEGAAAAAGSGNFEDLNRNALSVGRRCFAGGDEPACTEFDKIFSNLSAYEQKGIPFCNLEVTRYVSYSVPCIYEQKYFHVFTGGVFGTSD